MDGAGFDGERVRTDIQNPVSSSILMSVPPSATPHGAVE